MKQLKLGQKAKKVKVKGYTATRYVTTKAKAKTKKRATKRKGKK